MQSYIYKNEWKSHPKDRGSPPARIDIPPDKDASKRSDANATETIQVYSDGSGLQQFSGEKVKLIVY